MKPVCPVCSRPFPREERGRELGGLWTPRRTSCPECKSPLQWPLWAWRLQWAALFCLLPAFFRDAPSGLRAAGMGGCLILGIVAWRGLRLRSSDDLSSDSLLESRGNCGKGSSFKGDSGS